MFEQTIKEYLDHVELRLIVNLDEHLIETLRTLTVVELEKEMNVHAVFFTVLFIKNGKKVLIPMSRYGSRPIEAQYPRGYGKIVDDELELVLPFYFPELKELNLEYKNANLVELIKIFEDILERILHEEYETKITS